MHLSQNLAISSQQKKAQNNCKHYVVDPSGHSHVCHTCFLFTEVGGDVLRNEDLMKVGLYYLYALVFFRCFEFRTNAALVVCACVQLFPGDEHMGVGSQVRASRGRFTGLLRSVSWVPISTTPWVTLPTSEAESVFSRFLSFLVRSYPLLPQWLLPLVAGSGWRALTEMRVESL